MSKNRLQYAFLDSGIGGLPYLQFLLEKVPEASCAYVADTAEFPYGEKSEAEVIACAEKVLSKIVKKLQPELVIVACNTISVSALASLRAKFDLPFVGTFPAIKPASKQSKNKRIGVLATERTVKHPYTAELIEKFASDCHVVLRGDGDLVRAVEKGLGRASLAEKQASFQPALDFFRAEKVDHIVLACTHFLHWRDTWQEQAGDIKLIDSLEGVIKQALHLSLCQNSTNFSSKRQLFVTSTEPEILENYQKYARMFGLELEILE